MVSSSSNSNIGNSNSIGMDSESSLKHSNNSVGNDFSWKLSSIIATARRYRGLKDCALELFFYEDNVYNSSSGGGASSTSSSSILGEDVNDENSTSILVAFESKMDRELVMELLPKVRFINDCQRVAPSARVQNPSSSTLSALTNSNDNDKGKDNYNMEEKKEMNSNVNQ